MAAAEFALLEDPAERLRVRGSGTLEITRLEANSFVATRCTFTSATNELDRQPEGGLLAPS